MNCLNTWTVYLLTTLLLSESVHDGYALPGKIFHRKGVSNFGRFFFWLLLLMLKCYLTSFPAQPIGLIMTLLRGNCKFESYPRCVNFIHQQLSFYIYLKFCNSLTLSVFSTGPVTSPRSDLVQPILISVFASIAILRPWDCLWIPDNDNNGFGDDGVYVCGRQHHHQQQNSLFFRTLRFPHYIITTEVCSPPAPPVPERITPRHHSRIKKTSLACKWAAKAR